MAEKDTESCWSVNTVDSDASRVRKMTTKGLHYSLDVKCNKLKQLKSKLVSIENKIVAFMSDFTKYEDVRSEYTSWLVIFEDFMKDTSDFSYLIESSDDIPTQFPDMLSSFSEHLHAFNQFKDSVNSWIQDKEAERQKKAKKSDKMTMKSKSLRSSSTRSSISAARLKEKQLKAELTAKAASFEEKQAIEMKSKSLEQALEMKSKSLEQALEMEKLKLKLEEEKLSLRTKIAVSDARSKVLDDFDDSSDLESTDDNKFVLDDETIKRHVFGDPGPKDDMQQHVKKDIKVEHPSSGGNQPPGTLRHVINVTHRDDHQVTKQPKANVPSSPGGNVPSSGGNRTTRSYPERRTSNERLCVTEIVNQLNKPVPEINVFSGNPMQYRRFVRQFKTKVLNKTDDVDERMSYLEQFTSGDAKKIVASYVSLDARIGYPAAIADLEEKYGDDDVIVNSFISKALSWPVIRSDSPQGLEDFAVFLNECKNAVGGSSVLDNTDNIRKIIAKLPYQYQDRFRSYVDRFRDVDLAVKFNHVVSFLRKEAKKANDPVFGKDALRSLQPPPKQAKGKGPASKLSNATEVKPSSPTERSKGKCFFCGLENHHVSTCKKFAALTYDKRKNFVMEQRLCFRCLSHGHRSKDCHVKIVCTVCQGRHNTLFHMDIPSRPADHSQTNDTHASNSCFSLDIGVGVRDDDVCTLVIVPVKVKMRNSSHIVETYAFLDPGSSSTLCTESLMRRLGGTGKHMRINIKSMGYPRTIDSYSLTGLQVFDISMEHRVDLPKVFTVDKLSVDKVHIPTEDDIKKWPHLNDVTMPTINADIGLLIGNNVADAYTPMDTRVGPTNSPHATKTRLGWAVWNLTRPCSPNTSTSDCLMNRTEVSAIQDHAGLSELTRLVTRSFNADFPEKLTDDERQMSQEDKHFMKIVEDTLELRNGHYQMALPFRNKEVKFPNNYGAAYGHLMKKKRNLEADDNFRKDYEAFMKKLFTKDFAEVIAEDEDETDDGTWYIPHHGVFHPQKKKIRVVFNCAFVYKGMSLNQQLLSGPDLTNSLLGVLLKFRQEQYAAMGDIESMFYQVRVIEEHWNYQRFLWWVDGDYSKEPVKCRMKVHMFRTTSSPSCSNAALRQTATDNEENFDSSVTDVVKNNFYVDDCLTSEPTASEAADKVHDVTDLCSRGGFKLTKWISNDSAVLNGIPSENRSEAVKDLPFDERKDGATVERALGVKWKVQEDTLGFNVKVKDKEPTRRTLLSVVSSIYDPLGLGSPYILKARILLQEICQLGIGWDEDVPESQLKSWLKWLADLPRLEELCVPRCYKPPDFGNVDVCQLHVFADASEVGYGVTMYFRFVNDAGKVHCSLVFSKARVTPLKKITIPRLELTAACAAVRLSQLVQKQIQYRIDQVIYWTDSMTVLRYLANVKTRFKTFVANRIAVIRDGSDIEHWRYVPTQQNPADAASRGMNMSDFISYAPTWFTGPSFLLESEEKWPEIETGNVDEDDPEIKMVNTAVLKKTQESPIETLIAYCSSWMKLKRFVGYYLLFLEYLKAKKRMKSEMKTDVTCQLDLPTLQKAERLIVAHEQRLNFPELFDGKELGSNVSKSIKKLDPVIVDGVVRVGGRLSRSNLQFESKHPILLPKDSRVSHLIVQDAHKIVGHLGRASMTAQLRQRYWIVGLGRLIKSITSKCVICKSYVAKQNEQKMADLPLDRVVHDEAPFTRVGVDYFGPFVIKRGQINLKRYGVVFTCFASRAIHLEVATQLDTTSCINAIRRFIARRGCPRKIWSDNGTNFVGSKRELGDALDTWNQKQVRDEMIQKGVVWEFNPPMGSHFGGAWERMIRTIRKILYSLLHSQVIRLEGLSTLFCEVESIVNNRPITNVSSDLNDLSPLTPSHLLLLRSGETLPPGIFDESDCYTKRKWKQIQHLADVFWTRWSKEYLTSLQERQKWLSPRRNVTIDDIVLVKDNLPRNSWCLGRVSNVIMDKKGLVRMVEVETSGSVLTRPIDKLCVLVEGEASKVGH